MHWPAKLHTRPDHGAKRTIRRFAWFPTLVDTEDDPPMRVWLEFYYAYQEAGSDGYGGLQWRTLARYSGIPV